MGLPRRNSAWVGRKAFLPTAVPGCRFIDILPVGLRAGPVTKQEGGPKKQERVPRGRD